MINRRVVGWVLTLSVVLLPTGARGGRDVKTLALEAGTLSFNVGFDGESPAGSGLLHAGELDGDSAFGLSFEYGIRDFVGIRAGFLQGDVEVSAASECPSPPCQFTKGNAMVIVSVADWSVDESVSFRAPFVEVPFYLRPGRFVELFAGPTIASVRLDDASSSGLTGLIVDIDPPSISFGYHAGANFDLGWNRKWMIGVVARSIPADIDFTVRQPLLSPLREDFSDDEDALIIGLRVGRRFGR